MVFVALAAGAVLLGRPVLIRAEREPDVVRLLGDPRLAGERTGA